MTGDAERFLCPACEEGLIDRDACRNCGFVAPFRGGQGRSAEEIEAEGNALAGLALWIVTAVTIVTVAVGMYVGVGAIVRELR